MDFDYDKAADHYDKFRSGGGPFLDFLVGLAKESRAECVLELGAGTGNNTGVFLEKYPCRLVALEPSLAMLNRGAKKVSRACWIRGDGRHIPLKSGSVDFVFAVLVLHHISEIELVFRECRRVLRRGAAAFVTSPHDFIDRHPLNRFFPSFARIDKARFHPVEKIEATLVRSGFARVGSKRIVGTPQLIDRAYLAKVEGKFLSTFSLLPPEEFERGVNLMRSELERQEPLPYAVAWESVTVWGRVE